MSKIPRPAVPLFGLVFLVRVFLLPEMGPHGQAHYSPLRPDPPRRAKGFSGVLVDEKVSSEDHLLQALSGTARHRRVPLADSVSSPITYVVSRRDPASRRNHTHIRVSFGRASGASYICRFMDGCAC